MAKAKCDVAVVGAGILGLAVAEAAARRGADVVVVEAQTVGAGASGGLVGALSPHAPERWNPKKAFQATALAEADRYWRGIAERGGRDPGFRRAGRLLPLTTDRARESAEARACAAAAVWPAGFHWRLCPPDAWSDWLDPSAAPAGMVHETLSGQIDPRRALPALVAALAAAGGRLWEGWPVAEIAPGRVAGPRG
ncbi:MAG: FAD-dependent oxidoreductase, partial [Pseudomonadota bacterium]